MTRNINLASNYHKDNEISKTNKTNEKYKGILQIVDVASKMMHIVCGMMSEKVQRKREMSSKSTHVKEMSHDIFMKVK